MSLLLEVCVDSVDAAINAMKAGADRIEICSRLDKGGLSPSMGVVMDIAGQRYDLGLEEKVSLFAMVRPDDGGAFLYSQADKENMMNEIRQYGSCKVMNGVVFGLLEECNGDIRIDMQSVKAMALEAHRLGLDATFHRAFDKVVDKYKALEFLVNECSICRVLTSGKAEVAIESVDLLRDLVHYCDDYLGGRISVMPGSGITQENAAYIIKHTGATQIHGSFAGSYNNILEVRKIMQHM